MAESSGTSNPNVAKIAIDQRRKLGADTVEPQVISEDFLINGVEEPVRPDGEPWLAIDFPKVTSMRLSFKNIIEISNLSNLDSLTTLRLDNNIIEKIENLKQLKQLTWLDLSFNNIKEIEGLDELTNLLDLSLYHNQIEEIKGLDGCPNLNILSLGHNQIKEKEQINYLRKFKNLRCVCLDGNKVCQIDVYKQHVYAFLSNLKYLDYMLIDRQQVSQVVEGYLMDDLNDLKEKEQSDDASLKTQREKDAIIEELKGQFLDYTEDLFEELFNKKTEPDHVLALNCYPTLKEDFKEKLAEEVKHLRVELKERNDVRVKKVNAFEKAVKMAERESEEEAFQLVGDFQRHKKKVLASLEPREEGMGLKPEQEACVQNLRDQLGELNNQLMASEVQLQESISEAISQFEAKIREIMTQMFEKASDFFKTLEDHGGNFKSLLSEGANSEMEAVLNPDLIPSNQEIDPVKSALLSSREEMNQACTQFTENQMTTLQAKQDYMENSMKNWEKLFFEKHRENQYHRNRQRVMDVEKICEEARMEIIMASEVDNDYDENDGQGDFQYGR